MKHRKKRKNLFKFSLFIPFLVLPVSCSTTWTKWKKTDEPPVTYDLDIDETTSENLWKVRSDTILINSWVESNHSLFLDGLNNQFELIRVLGILLSFQFFQNSLDSYYKNYNAMASQLSNIENNLPFKINIKYQNHSSEIEWNFDFSSINSALQAADATPYLKIPDKEIENGAVKLSFLIGDNKDKFKDLIENPKPPFDSFYKLSLTDALRFAKLANIPKDAYDGMKNFIYYLPNFFNSVYGTNPFKKWINAKHLNLSLKSNGGLSSFTFKTDEEKANFLASLFILKVLLKSNY